MLLNLLGPEKNLSLCKLYNSRNDICHGKQKSCRLHCKLWFKNGWLYRTADEAMAAGVANPELIRKISKLGPYMKTELSDLYTSPEYVQMFKGTGGVLDNLIISYLQRNYAEKF